MSSVDYTETLKKIKETEEASNQAVSERRKALEAELRGMEEESMRSIDAARAEAEAYVSSEVEKTRAAAQAEADRTLASARKEADALASKRLDKRELRKMVDDILLAEFKGN